MESDQKVSVVSKNVVEWIPTRYRLQLSFNEHCSEFLGTCVINIECTVENLKAISLDAVSSEMQISEAFAQQGKAKMICKVFGDSSQRKIKLVLPTPLIVGKAILGLRYKVSVRDDCLGVYKISTLNTTPNKNLPNDKSNLATDALIVTHFEPSFAALCFPCITETSVRAPFSLIVTVPMPLQVISCMPLLQETSEKEDFITYQFTETPSIPSYLLAFAIGQFFLEENKFTSISGKDVPVRVLVPKSHFAESKAKTIASNLLSASISILYRLEKYFNTSFWAPKLDVIAIPQMLLVGMENHGCCFLHVLPTNDDFSSTKQDLVHELAHQWIGNFVGMPLGMKEGLVQHIEKVIYNELFPQSGVKKAPKKKTTQQVKTFSSKKMDTNTISYQLMQDFLTEMNEGFYQRSLKRMEAEIEKCGEKVFEERLCAMIKALPQSFIEEETVLKWISGI